MKIASNIYEIPHGYRVIINRPEIRYQVFVAFGTDKAAALQRAIAERDQFFALHGKFGTSGQRVRSNTGVAGVSETVKWVGNNSYNCFQVTAGSCHKGIEKFFYRGAAQRSRVLRAAIARRSQLAGEDAAQLLAQAEKAGAL